MATPAHTLKSTDAQEELDREIAALLPAQGEWSPEYWIVDPQTETIMVLLLEGAKYVEHGVFPRGSAATSALLAGFEVSVDAVFDAE